MINTGHFARTFCFLGCALFLPIVVRGESAFINAGVNAKFEEMGYAGESDIFTFTNTSQDDAKIMRIVIDTDPSFASVFFNPAGQNCSPFLADAACASDTGFMGFVNTTDNSTQLILEFTDFDPGETFRFEVDIDDRFGWYVTGRDFGGTMLNTIFGITDSTAELFGAFQKGASWSLAEADLQGPAEITNFSNPEPSSLVLMAIGASTLGLRFWRSKRKRGLQPSFPA